MATGHAIQSTLANWRLPSDTQAGPGWPIIEEVASTSQEHNDTVGAIAKMINNLWQELRPQLVFDRYATLGISPSGTGSYETLSRYMIPGEVVASYHATSAITETLISRTNVQVSGGDSAAIRVDTPTNAVAADASSVTSAAWVSTGSPTIQATDGDSGDLEITVNGNVTTTASNLDLFGFSLWWDASRTSIPNGPYATEDLVALYTSLYTNKAACLSPQKIRRLAKALLYLKKRRLPGVVMNGYSEVGTSQSVATRCLAWQSEYVSKMRVYVYAEDNGSGSTLSATLTSGRTTATDTTSLAASAPAQWKVFDLEVEPRRAGQAPLPWELKTGASGATIYGASAWWRPIEVEVG